MRDLNAVKAGMDLLTWDLSEEAWADVIARRQTFLERRMSEVQRDGLVYAELVSAQNQARRLERQGPQTVLFTSTGVQVGRRARRWRSSWFQLSYMKIVRAGWEVLWLKWLHVWGITAREMIIPLPEGAASHVAEMAEVILERNPYQSKIEIVDEEPESLSETDAHSR